MSAAATLVRVLEAAPRFSPRLLPGRCGPLLQSATARRQVGGEAAAAAPWRASARCLSTCRSRPSVLDREGVRLVRHAFASTRANTRRISTTTATAGTKSKKGWPTTSSNRVGYFLLLSAASVFGIVVFGGLTRLTESGLSITEWRPVTGSLPPLSAADWEGEFAKYRASPEFQVLNSRMTLDEFKSIYWMEWIHRLWGRAIGVSFVLPAVYFVARRQVSRRMAGRLLAIAGLIGFQGFLGWWMVKSGLRDDLFAPGAHPRVSQYRLAAHLGAAFVVYLTMLHSGLAILRTNRILSSARSGGAAATSTVIAALTNPRLRPFRLATGLFCALVFTTAMSGALVAGLDAGLIYNEFPFMGLGLAPPRAELLDPWYSRVPADPATGRHSDLVWRNMCENPSLVQLDHRILATSVFVAAHALMAYARLSPTVSRELPRAAARAVHGVLGFAWLQVALGISTLVYLVPTPLASMHQAGALLLLTWSFVLGSRVWVPRYAVSVLQRTAAPTTATTAAAAAAGTRTAAPHVANAMAAFPAAAWAGWMLTASSPRPPVSDPGEKEHEDRMSETAAREREFLQRQSKAWRYSDV